ncbi:hypothetical protein DMI65_20535 [Escherichia coli]|nr:hypothetical protein [Escherichia coli]
MMMRGGTSRGAFPVSGTSTRRSNAAR